VHAIEELNAVPASEFAAAVRALFEAAEPLAAALAAERPFASYEELLDRAAHIAQQLPRDAQIAVVNAHPRIGESAQAVRATSESSYREQGYDRERDIDPGVLAATYATLRELNQAYERRFGFRFVVFVNGRSKSEIVDVLRTRLANPADQELQTALDEMLRIARDRLQRARAAVQ
jgi:OHCU decarboxylase